MNIKPQAVAVWKGSGKEGTGHLSTRSNALQETPYTFKSRFEGGVGTTPEELVAAAHAGCFTMKLAFEIGAAGFVPDSLNTNCSVKFENGAVIASTLHVTGIVPNMTDEKFQEVIREAGKNCPISKLLNAEIIVSGEMA
ncbi:MAG: OsmC family peroxiredoxin [Bacteroidales bacterium]|nr:OsmC family peroxiredoxin [Bacteroidales bacterium]